MNQFKSSTLKIINVQEPILVGEMKLIQNDLSFFGTALCSLYISFLVPYCFNTSLTKVIVMSKTSTLHPTPPPPSPYYFTKDSKPIDK